MPEVVTLTRPLTHTREHRNTRVLLRDVANQLSNNHRLANTRTAVSPDLSTSRERRNKVKNLDPRLENLSSSRLLSESRRLSVDRQSVCIRRNLIATVNRIA